MNRIALSLLGFEVLALEWGAEDEDDDQQRDLSGGTTSSMPVGFTPSWPDQRWQPGGEP